MHVTHARIIPEQGRTQKHEKSAPGTTGGDCVQEINK